jgi:hypothetical protein
MLNIEIERGELFGLSGLPSVQLLRRHEVAQISMVREYGDRMLATL